jgi:hypothetical protein
LQPDVGTVRRQRVGHAGDQRVVHVAGQLGLLLGQRVERAIGELDLAGDRTRLVAMPTQHPQRELECRRGVRGRALGGADRLAVVVGDPVQHVDGRFPGATVPGFYDIALRDFGLLVGAVALARLAQGVHNGSISVGPR